MIVKNLERIGRIVVQLDAFLETEKLDYEDYCALRESTTLLKTVLYRHRKDSERVEYVDAGTSSIDHDAS